jgi:hypothetical protein
MEHGQEETIHTSFSSSAWKAMTTWWMRRTYLILGLVEQGLETPKIHRIEA